MTFRVNVVSYNVLSDVLADPKHYCFTDPADLAADIRFGRVKEQLVYHMRASSIVCLQEVSRTWGASLVQFWEKHDYAYVNALSGPEMNNYMGQVIAWPRQIFAVDNCAVIRVADTVEWPKRSKGKLKSKRLDVWKEVRRRHNCVALARLRQRTTGILFVVGTYHMPCLFGSNQKLQVMNAHCAMLFVHAQKYANGLPLVVVGDFNFKPHDSSYDLVCKGCLEDGHPLAPPAYDEAVDDWQPPMRFSPMRSAYAVLGEEGRKGSSARQSFTNYAKTKGAETFCETLDYIWVSGEWGVCSAGPLPTRGSVAAASFPSPTQPSDHLLISAELELGAATSPISRL
jgi:2',5'-phosphodiesterase